MMDRLRLLLSDDDKVFSQLAGELLQQLGYDVFRALTVNDSVEILSRNKIDIMLLDMCFPALMDGFNLLESVRRKYTQMPVLMISGSGHIPDAVRAIKMGASDYIEKPIEPEYLATRVQNLAELIIKERKLRQLEQAAMGMVGCSSGILEVFDQIRTAAKYTQPVLVTGETGVGKELAARAVHLLGPRGSKDLVCVNCASVPKDLFEAELFGYEKGSFTGATRSSKGYFDFAKDTSLFLDEIAELPQTVQAKLLRVISEGEIQRIGGGVVPAGTRIISASNHDLEAEVKKGVFREDLFFRLNSVEIRIPPLRERVEDIPLLARHFVNQFCQRAERLPAEISPRAMAWLEDQLWEGNVRELKNCVERTLIFSEREVLEPDDFIGQHKRKQADEYPAGTLRASLTQHEKRIIEQQLKENGFNISQTARCLGMDKSNLSKRIRQLEIALPESRDHSLT